MQSMILTEYVVQSHRQVTCLFCIEIEDHLFERRCVTFVEIIEWVHELE